MPMHEMMAMPLLPRWLAIAWAVALLGVVVLHIHHAWPMSGQPRWWHIGHTAMAAGMIGMYLLPTMTQPALARAGLVLFSAITVAVLATTMVCRQHEGALNPLWLATGLDMLAMTYMFLPATGRPATLTWIAIAYLAGHASAWASNLWSRIPLHSTITSGATAVGAGDGPGAAQAHRPTLGLSGETDLGVRITLAVMAASMAYMLLAMRLGTS